MPDFYTTVDASTLRAYMPNVPYLLPAASWWRTDVELKRPPRLPSHVEHVGVDSGAFAILQRWSEYWFTARQYVDWIHGIQPGVRWAASPDFPCEGASPEEVRQRQSQSDVCLEYLLEHHLDAPWCWVPTVQGWVVEDYVRHCIRLAPVLYALQEVYGARGMGDTFRVGVGSICRRGQTVQILAIVETVAALLPGIPLHLWGVKLGAIAAIRDRGLFGSVASFDSSAWNGRFGRDLEEYRQTDLTQRQYALTVKLPAYLDKVERQLATPYTAPMF